MTFKHGGLCIFLTLYVVLSESLCLSRSDKTLERTYEVSDNAVSNAISLIENKKKSLVGVQTASYIKSKEAAGIRINPEVYGRYAEAFGCWKAWIPEDVQVDTSKVIEACEIFLNSTRGADNITMRCWHCRYIERIAFTRIRGERCPNFE